MRPPKHGPNRLHSYRSDHDSILGKFEQREFLVENGLVWLEQGGDFLLEGELGCRGNIIITVEKVLEVLESGVANPLVQTIYYSYNASVRSAGSFLRYDNAHQRKGHPTPHHRHEMDWRTSEEKPNSPICIGWNWPTLGEFLDEVADWYWDHRELLPEPDGIPTLGLR